MVFQGTDTVGITVASALLILAKYPDIQVHFVFFRIYIIRNILLVRNKGRTRSSCNLNSGLKYKGSSLGCWREQSLWRYYGDSNLVPG